MKRSALHFVLLASILAACSHDRLHTRPEGLSLDDIFHPDKKVEFSGKWPSGFAWIDDDHYILPKREDDQTHWVKVHAQSGVASPFFDEARMISTLAAVEDMTQEKAEKMTRSRFRMDEAHETALITIEEDAYAYHLESGRLTRLSQADGKEELATFSSDGTRVAYVRDNDLYVSDVASGREQRLTFDGSKTIFNGKLDWIYQEEIYGRGQFRSFWWSPDSKRIAFLHLDESEVPTYTIVDDMETRPEVNVYAYPKAGDPNPTVKLGLIDITQNPARTNWVDLAGYESFEPLVVDVSWSPDGALAWQVQDREQRWLELNLTDPASLATQRILREESPASTWVSLNGSPEWLDDGTFLWFSERSGWKHLYHYGPDGTLLHQVTDGDWEARTLHGLDEEGWAYFSGTEHRPIDVHVYRARLDGTGMERLSTESGTHTANFNPSFTSYIDTFSNITTPPRVLLMRTDGAIARVIEENPASDELVAVFSEPEFVQVPTPDGFQMEAMLIKPVPFDPKKRYPVYQHTYAGPHAPTVRNRWAGSRGMFWQLLAQKGIVVWVCDNRTASGKGAESAWPVYEHMVEGELADIESGLDWLKRKPWVDPDRIGINGWSFGGLMVCYALTHSKSFKMGIAGGSVTDWHNYDSIYTERYMRTPQNNPKGYESTSPSKAAADLSGELLLVHGALDDNVHPQNTMQFAYELQKAGKSFRMMLYPKSKHSVREGKLSYHMQRMMLGFIEETLLD